MSNSVDQFPANFDAHLEELRQSRELLLQAAESAPLDDHVTGINPDHWSVAEIIFHLHLAEKRTMAGLKRSLESPARVAAAAESTLRIEWERIRSVIGTRTMKAKAPPRVEPSNAPSRAEAIGLIQQSRQELLAALQNVSYQELLAVSMPHPFERVGILTGVGWLSAIAFHDIRHAEQIREMKLS